MGIDNTLNVSELLRRLGAKGDSLGSAPLLESLRMSIQIADLSDLVPPLTGPIGGAGLSNTSGVATFNNFQLRSRSPAGLTVMSLESNIGDFDVWISDENPFGGGALSAAHNLAFGQEVEAFFTTRDPAAKVAPAGVFFFGGAFPSVMERVFPNWVGPGQHFNIEARGSNVAQSMRITWKEYPAGLNP